MMRLAVLAARLSVLQRAHLSIRCPLVLRGPAIAISRAISNDSESRWIDVDDHGKELYGVTRPRFVADEKRNMAIRYRRFNAFELGKVAAKAIGSEACVKIEKHADGSCDRVFTLTMDDGKVAFAKIPNPKDGPPHYITASEVATTEDMREVLPTPTPKILAWCSRAEQTPVEAEYIIIEKARGVPLQNLYRAMSVSERYAVLQAITRYQVVWTQAHFDRYGSLFYRADLRDEERIGLCDEKGGGSKYAIGPSTSRDWYEDGRLDAKFYRGPWKSPEAYLEAIGHRETACVEQIEQLPFSSLTLHGPRTHRPSRKKIAAAIQQYLDLFRVVTRDRDVEQQPCVWHGDLHEANIFVDPDNTTTVTGILDWQFVEIAPLFAQIRQPCFLDYEGPQLEGVERPKLPDDYHELPLEEKHQAAILYNAASLSALYRFWLRVHNPTARKGMQFQDSPAYDILLLARKLFTDGEALYMAKLLDLEDSCPEALGEHAPNSSAEVKAEILADAEAAAHGMQVMDGIKNTLGDLFPERGFLVRPDRYDEVKDALRQMKEQVIEQYASNEEEKTEWEKVWSWDD